jgi:hypothetical protein
VFQDISDESLSNSLELKTVGRNNTHVFEFLLGKVGEQVLDYSYLAVVVVVLLPLRKMVGFHVLVLAKGMRDE